MFPGLDGFLILLCRDEVLLLGIELKKRDLVQEIPAHAHTMLLDLVDGNQIRLVHLLLRGLQ
jgi:hypothetical protein